MATALSIPTLATRAGTTTPSEELLASARAGDRDALEDLLTLIERRVYALAYRLCWDPVQAEDLAQEALLKLCRHIGRYRLGSNFWAWMTRIVVNQSRDTWRTSKPHDELDEALAAAVEYEPVRSDQLRHVRIAMRVLTEKEREAVVLMDIEGYTAKEASKILRCLPITVRTRATQARKRLRKVLSRHYPELREAI